MDPTWLTLLLLGLATVGMWRDAGVWKISLGLVRVVINQQ
eukprot:COSAG02_NODE_29806_length_562_cov_1.220302_1_plen_39_part_10